jgi:thioredoxin reductase (NADPH)
VEACRVDEYDEEMSPTCLSKLICVKNENMRVVGIHFIGPNAGEVIQGYALALRLGATKVVLCILYFILLNMFFFFFFFLQKDFDACIGIHPTSAESFHSLQITKASGENFRATGGCGGGKCG